MAELREIVGELSRSTRELRESQKTTDRQMAETDRRMAETDRRMAETDRRMAESKAKTDRQLEETSRELKKFIGSVGSEWGHLVESLTEPSCLGELQKAGIDVTQKTGETISTRPGYEQEWDVLLINGGELVAVEVKSRFRPRDLDRVEEKLGKFKDAFPHFAGCKIFGAVAAIKYDAGLERLAEKRGLFVFMPSGQIMKLRNSESFRPKAY